MSKYKSLWKWINENGTDSFSLTYAEIEKIAGLPIDHSFLKYKKELLEYGFQVGKISLKEQTVMFNKIEVVRKLSENEISAALELAWRVFSEYESPDYAPEGTEEFRRCLHDKEYLSGIEYYGTFYGEKLIGVIGIRADKKHICFFFVDGNYHRQGVGTRLFRHLTDDYLGETITLNSSPYAVPFYKAIGFEPTEEEKTVNGIRFTPMEYVVKEKHHHE